MDTVSPDVDDWLIVQFRFSPAVVFRGPIVLKSRNRIRRKSHCSRAQKNLEGWSHFTTGNPFEVEPWQGRFQRLGSAHIGWHQGRAERHRCAVLGTNLWNAHAHRPNARLEWTGWMMPIAHDSSVTCISAQVGKLRQITGKLGFNSCRDQFLRSRSEQIRQRIRHPVSTRKINNVSRFHGGVSPSVGLLSHNNNSTRYAANLQTTQTPDSVIAHHRQTAMLLAPVDSV